MDSIKEFSCSFYPIDKKEIWYLRVIAEDCIMISEYYSSLQLSLKFKEYPEVIEEPTVWHGGGVDHSIVFKSNGFDMTVYYKEYYEDDNDENKITSFDGFIMIQHNNLSFGYHIPYDVAKGLCNLAKGETDLTNAHNICIEKF